MKKRILENNIDRLEIAYKLDEDVIKTILDKSNADGVVHYDDFLLIRTKTFNEFEFNYDIVCVTHYLMKRGRYINSYGVSCNGGHIENATYISMYLTEHFTTIHYLLFILSLTPSV